MKQLTAATEDTATMMTAQEGDCCSPQEIFCEYCFMEAECDAARQGKVNAVSVIRVGMAEMYLEQLNKGAKNQ